MGSPEKGCFLTKMVLSGGVFGNSLGTLRHGMFGEFPWEKKSDSSLDFPGRNGVLLVHLCELSRLLGNTLEDIIDKRVHDTHGLGRDSGVGVHLLKHLVHIDGEGSLGLALGFNSCGTSDLLGCFLTCHFMI